MDITLVWAVIIVSGVVVYVMLDGFDLGLGILFPFAPTDEHRDIMMRSIAPVWDGNETWLILGGAGLFAAFPKAYAMLLPVFYIPLMLMLFALILRGVAFEFRFKAGRSRYLWDLSFSLGGWLAAFCQGIIAGAIVQGIPVSDGQYAGGAWDWLTPFTVFTGLALIVGYALLGSTWLVMKTLGELQQWSYRLARPLLVGVLVCIGVVSLWTPLAEPAVAERWFSLPNFYYLSQVPFAIFLLSASCWYVLKREQRKHQSYPFYLSLGLFVLAHLGFVISIWPYIVPRALTFWDAAAPFSTQLFVLVGFLVLLPFVVHHTLLGYRVFKGKVTADQSYY